MTIDQAVSLQEVVWTLTGLLSLFGASGLLVYRVGNWKYQLEKHPKNCSQRRIAWIFLRNNTFLWLLAFMLFAIGIQALATPNPPDRTWESIKGGWILIGINLGLCFGILWELYDQWMLLRKVRKEKVDVRDNESRPGSFHEAHRWPDI